MWRHLAKAIERSLILTAQPLPCRSKALQWHGPMARIHLSPPVITSTPLHNTESSELNDSAADEEARRHNEGDAEYIVPYRAEYEKPSNASNLLDILSSRFRLSETDIQHILSHEVVVKSFKKKSFILTMETLLAEGVRKRNFVEYPWVITLERHRLVEKINLIKSLRGFRDLNDFVPFLRIQLPRFRKIISSMNREADSIEHGNRVYHLSEKLGIAVCDVTRHLAKRLFILEMPLEMFEANLKHMLDYNVQPRNILKDLWAFRYTPRSVELRLRRAKSAKKDKIMPWMVRCPESILQKSLQLSLDELQVLDHRSSVAEYLGDRLGFSPEAAQAIMNRHPQVNTVRVTKIKEVLDYLLESEKFSRYDIAQVPRILCHSLETTKQRIEELKKHGCRPSSLVIVCRSKREYEKFLNAWIASYNPNYKASEKNESNKETNC